MVCDLSESLCRLNLFRLPKPRMARFDYPQRTTLGLRRSLLWIFLPELRILSNIFPGATGKLAAENLEAYWGYPRRALLVSESFETNSGDPLRIFPETRCWFLLKTRCEHPAPDKPVADALGNMLQMSLETPCWGPWKNLFVGTCGTEWSRYDLSEWSCGWSKRLYSQKQLADYKDRSADTLLLIVEMDCELSYWSQKTKTVYPKTIWRGLTAES